MSNRLSDSPNAGVSPDDAPDAGEPTDIDGELVAIRTAAAGRSRRKRHPSTRHQIRRMVRRYNLFVTIGRWLLGLLLLILIGWVLVNYIYPPWLGGGGR